MRVFVGITGASGAPYAARLLQALAAGGCEIGVCASRAGVEVIATELYGNAKLSRDETLARLLEHGAQLVGKVEYQDVYRLCYIRGPGGLLIGLAQELG